jgi:hypothetical protein
MSDPTLQWCPGDSPAPPATPKCGGPPRSRWALAPHAPRCSHVTRHPRHAKGHGALIGHGAGHGIDSRCAASPRPAGGHAPTAYDRPTVQGLQDSASYPRLGRAGSDSLSLDPWDVGAAWPESPSGCSPRRYPGPGGQRSCHSSESIPAGPGPSQARFITPALRLGLSQSRCRASSGSI